LLRTGGRIRSGTHVLDVRWLESAKGHVRIAIVVPKHGFSAVRRNRLKRRLRELARTHLLSGEGSADVLLRAKRETYAATFEALRDDIVRAASRLGRAP